MLFPPVSSCIWKVKIITITSVVTMKSHVVRQFKVKVNKTMQALKNSYVQTKVSNSAAQEQAKEKNALEDPIKHEQNYFAKLVDDP